MAPPKRRYNFGDVRPSQQEIRFTDTEAEAPAFTMAEFGAAPGTEGARRFQPLPTPTGKAPYHLNLETVLPADVLKRIRSSGKMVLHIVGDTGGVKRPQFQI